jgi:redox-regulated HSP33 family molecular chaperone
MRGIAIPRIWSFIPKPEKNTPLPQPVQMLVVDYRSSGDLRGYVGFDADEIRDMAEDGKIRVTCEFCNARYEFEPQEF